MFNPSNYSSGQSLHSPSTSQYNTIWSMLENFWKCNQRPLITMWLVRATPSHHRWLPCDWCRLYRHTTTGSAHWGSALMTQRQSIIIHKALISLVEMKITWTVLFSRWSWQVVSVNLTFTLIASQLRNLIKSLSFSLETSLLLSNHSSMQSLHSLDTSDY